MLEPRMMEDLMALDVNLCMRRNLDSSGNKAALLDRLLHSHGPRSQEKSAIPMVDDSPTLEVPLDTLPGEEKTVENIEMKKEKPKYPCTHCDNTFSSKNSRRRHLKRMHGNKNQQNKGQERVIRHNRLNPLPEMLKQG